MVFFSKRVIQSSFGLTSPHLLIYRPQITSLFSIFQRISGFLIFLSFYFYICFFVYSLFCVSNFSFYHGCLIFFKFSGFWYINCILFLLFWFVYHILNGFKVLAFEMETTGVFIRLDFYYVANFLVFVFSLISLVFVWFILFF